MQLTSAVDRSDAAGAERWRDDSTRASTNGIAAFKRHQFVDLDCGDILYMERITEQTVTLAVSLLLPTFAAGSLTS